MFHVKALFLPVGPPEWNAIEMVWGIVKRSAAERKLRFFLNDFGTHTMDLISKVTTEDFKKYASYVKKEYTNYCQLSEAVEQFIRIKFRGVDRGGQRHELHQ